MDIFWGAVFIMTLRIIDVSLGTIRTLLVVQGKKYPAGLIGFVEITIWIFAIRHIMLHLDNLWNVLGYAAGFAIGTVLGIALEQKFGLGFVQLHIVSLKHAGDIALALRKEQFGVTKLPGEGSTGGVTVLVLLTTRKRQREAMKIIDSIDEKAFVSIQSATPFRGFVQVRK